MLDKLNGYSYFQFKSKLNTEIKSPKHIIFKEDQGDQVHFTGRSNTDPIEKCQSDLKEAKKDLQKADGLYTTGKIKEARDKVKRALGYLERNPSICGRNPDLKETQNNLKTQATKLLTDTYKNQGLQREAEQCEKQIKQAARKARKLAKKLAS